MRCDLSTGVDLETTRRRLAHRPSRPAANLLLHPVDGIARSHHHGTTPLESSNGRRLAGLPNRWQRPPGCGRGWPDSCWSAISIHDICPSGPHVVRGALRQANEVCHTNLPPNHIWRRPAAAAAPSAVLPSKHTCPVPRRSCEKPSRASLECHSKAIASLSCSLDRGRMRRAAVKSVRPRLWTTLPSPISS